MNFKAHEISESHEIETPTNPKSPRIRVVCCCDKLIFITTLTFLWD